MDYQVALAFEDGVTRFITCADSQSVADASYRQRINIPVDCNDGACGTCRAFCESGSYDAGTYLEDALTSEEAQQGYCLPCQMKPQSDLVLQIAATSEVAKTIAASYNATIVGLDRLSSTTIRLSVEVPDRSKLTFLPGQYVNIAVPGTDAVRSYSFSNAPSDDRLTFLVKLIDGGAMSTWLTERAAVGDEFTFTGPHGSFFLREALRPALLLAGGTGLAPVLAMLRTLAHAGTSRTIHLVYGATTDVDVVELDTLRVGGRIGQLHVGLRCRRQGFIGGAQGLCDLADQAAARTQRRCRDLCVWPASHGGGRADPSARERDRADRVLLREVHAGHARYRGTGCCAGRGPCTRNRCGT